MRGAHAIDNGARGWAGWCHKLPPKMVNADTAAFPPIKLAAWCGGYRFSFLAWGRAFKRSWFYGKGG